jgi:hypothetical protein
MLYFLGVWTLLAIACGIIGLGWLNFLRADDINRPGDRAIAAFFLGLVTLAIALLTISLFIPLSSLVGILTIILFCGIALRSRRTRREIVRLKAYLSPKFAKTYFLLAVITAGSIGGQVVWIDTGLYHYGAIRWLADYGAVPGVALIHSRLGWASAWFAFAAPLNPTWLDSRGNAAANGLILLVAIAHWLIAGKRLFSPKAQLPDWFCGVVYPLALALFLAGRTLFRNVPTTWTFVNIVMSASQDFIVMLLIIITAWVMLIVSRAAAPESNTNAHLIPLILAAGAFTMKPTALPLIPAAGLFYLFARSWQWQRLLWASIVLAVFLIPTMAFGIITSGCPLSPSRVMCFDLPWTVPLPAEVAKSLGMEGGWQAWYGEPKTDVLYPLWLIRNWVEGSTILALLLGLTLVMLVLLGISLLKQAKSGDTSGQWWTILVSGLGLGFILWQSPLIRFALGYVILIPAIAIANWAWGRWGYWQVKAKQPSPLPTLLDLQKCLKWFLWGLAAVTIFTSLIESKFVLPLPLPVVRVLPARVNDVHYVYPIERVVGSREMLCWAATLPCSEFDEPQDNNVKLRQPEEGIAGGFVRADYE